MPKLCSLFAAILVLLGVVPTAAAQAPATPIDLRAENVTNFARNAIRVRWDETAEDTGGRRAGYELSRSTSADAGFEVIAAMLPPAMTEYVDKGEDDGVADDGVADDGDGFGLPEGTPFYYRLVAIGPTGERSAPITLQEPVATEVGPLASFQRSTPWILWNRRWLFVITAILCGSVIYWIEHARKGKPLKIRKIAGLEAVDEAVGRATEMGRSCLFVPGIQDMNDIQTIAGITVLARVARTAAEYDAKVEVPTARSLVMTTARETVQSAFLSAGRPDAYNADLIYYVSDEQFGYVAYLQGMMVREKPAACFYMGSFFAESLILAETGNSIGAIQVAGTAQPAQLPFFVAACDYTLIGEEFFAASAYLSGSPEELGSLKGADVGKVIVAIGIGVGVLLATLASILDSEGLADAVEYLKSNVLT